MRFVISVLLLVYGFVALGQQSCEVVERTDRPIKYWSYQNIPALKSKQLRADMKRKADTQINDYVAGSQGLTVLSYTLGIAGGGLVGYTAANLLFGGEFNNLKVGLMIGGGVAAGLSIGISFAAQNQYRKAMLRYNDLCDLRLGMASSSLGPGLYLTLK